HFLGVVEVELSRKRNDGGPVPAVGSGHRGFPSSGHSGTRSSRVRQRFLLPFPAVRRASPRRPFKQEWTRGARRHRSACRRRELPGRLGPVSAPAASAHPFALLL